MTEAAVIRVLASLALIIVVILALAWLARRSGWLQGKSQHRVRVISSQRLGARSHIAIVQVDDTELVLGVTPAQINVLHKIPASSSSTPSSGYDTSVRRSSTHDASGHDASAHRSADAHADAEPSRFRRLLDGKLAWLLTPVLIAVMLVLPESVQAQATLPALTVNPGDDGSQTWSLSVQTLVLLTMMSFLPAMLLTMTGFTRIIIVLSLLRNAMGTGASPPNSVLIGLALFLTLFAMSPVVDQVYSVAWEPLSAGEIEFQEALALGAEPLREFMLHQTRETDLMLFANMANIGELQSAADVPLRVLIPSFVTSELKTAFQIGFTIFIPFLIIDLVVASILMSLGMMMVPPVTISLPFKLMLFVLADGWHLLLGSLARSFYL